MKSLRTLIKKQIGNGGSKYWKYCGFSGYVDWCAMLVWWIIQKDGTYKYMAQGKNPYYVPNVVKYAEKNDLIIPREKVEVGDLVVYDFNKNGVGDHIGFFWGDKPDDAFAAVEGNTGPNPGRVKKRTRYEAQVLCYIRLKKQKKKKA